MQLIYIVEDDDNLRELLCYALQNAGFETEGFAGAEEFYSRLKKTAPRLILLDLMLPGEDGLSILGVLRRLEATRNLPVIILTAKGGEYDRIKGLDLGADDYVTKPFSVMELVARVRAVLRRAPDEPGRGAVFSSGGLTLSPERHTVLADGLALTLTHKEFALLECLLRNAGLVLTRDMLMERVWGFDFEGESRTVDMHIRSIRRKLGNMSGMIKTVRGVGYKLEANG
ncbi:MAG: response regulator transcription factor [Gracilibacteraceae bacterium]|jgi:two-component system alkaline phosphatase synthesis response regulator PhoP|nr:response regulator transcription factor [Gracilibacteraceae bacterium]